MFWPIALQDFVKFLQSVILLNLTTLNFTRFLFTDDRILHLSEENKSLEEEVKYYLIDKIYNF